MKASWLFRGSADLQVAQPPAWMIELAKQVGMIEADAELPTGVIVENAVTEKVIAPDGASDQFRWQLTYIKRRATPCKPKGHPQPVWCNPF